MITVIIEILAFISPPIPYGDRLLRWLGVPMDRGEDLPFGWRVAVGVVTVGVSGLVIAAIVSSLIN